MLDFKFNIEQRVLRARTYFSGEEHQVGYITGMLPKEITFSNYDHYIISVKGVNLIVPEKELVRILDWKCVCNSNADPFHPLDWMDREMTHYYNEENNWILTRRPNEDFMKNSYYKYLVSHPKDKNRIWYERRSDISACNAEAWI